MGITVSDTSSYIARAIFYDNLQDNKSALFMASAPNGNTGGIDFSNSAGPIFTSSGYNVDLDLQPENDVYNDGSRSWWTDRDLIFYYDHGNSYTAGDISTTYGTFSGNAPYLPYLDNTFVNTMACAVCRIYNNYTGSFCMQTMRQGAIGFLGATDYSYTYNSTGIIHSIYYENLPIGFAFIKYTSPYSGFGKEDTFLGDPTVIVGKQLLNQSLK